MNLMGIGFRAVRKPNLRGAHALYPIFQRLRRIAPFPGHKGREAAGYTTGFFLAKGRRGRLVDSFS